MFRGELKQKAGGFGSIGSRVAMILFGGEMFSSVLAIRIDRKVVVSICFSISPL